MNNRGLKDIVCSVEHKQHESMELSCLQLLVVYEDGGDGVGEVFLAHLGPSVQSEHHLNPTACLSIIADRVHPY